MLATSNEEEEINYLSEFEFVGTKNHGAKQVLRIVENVEPQEPLYYVDKEQQEKFSSKDGQPQGTGARVGDA